MPRKALKDNYINGLAIKEGTIVNINTYAVSFSEKYYKDPYKFRPERWLNGECDNLPQHVSLIGFGGGGRTCIGKHFSLL